MTQTPVQPAPEWRLQPVQIALIDLAGNALIGANLTLSPDSRTPVEVVGVDGPITVFPTQLGPFASVPGVLNGTAVGMIETSVPVSDDPVRNSELTYTGTLEWPDAGGFVTATVFVDDIADDGVLWIGPSFVAGTVEPGQAVSPAVTYASFASLQQAVQVLEETAGEGTVAASTDNLIGTGQTGREMMESATPAAALTALSLSPWAMTETGAGSGVFSLDGAAFAAPTGGLAGIGSPVGVVTSPLGVVYTDTAGTTGAWRWIKTSGVGSTGWTVLHGDTGLRNIDGLIQAPAEGIGTRIARVGTTVTLHFAVKAATAWASGVVLYPPAGFKGSEVLLRLPPHYYSGFGSSVLYRDSLRWLYDGVAPWCYAQWTWRTSDPWPTSLPGTAA